MSSWAVFPEEADNFVVSTGEEDTTNTNDGVGDAENLLWSNELWAMSFEEQTWTADFHSASSTNVNHPSFNVSSNFFDPFGSFSVNEFPHDDPFDDMFLDKAVVNDISSSSSDNEVHVAIHEQLSSLYCNDYSEPPEIQVVGYIHVRLRNGFVFGGSSSSSLSFCLSVKDSTGQIEQFQHDKNVCYDMTKEVPNAMLANGDRVMRVKICEPNKQVTIATYTCKSTVHPIPLLVKSKVRVTKELCRVGIRMRANPTNNSPLTNGAILMAVPPDIKGDSIKTSREGSAWDAMKRVVAWSLDELEPGQSMEIQAQFEFVTALEPNGPPRPHPKFPVLVRFDATNAQFSDVQLNSELSDNQSLPVKLKLSRSVRVLHRKV